MSLSEIFFFATIFAISLTMGATLLTREHFQITRIKRGSTPECRRRHSRIVTIIALGGLAVTAVFHHLTQVFSVLG